MTPVVRLAIGAIFSLILFICSQKLNKLFANFTRAAYLRREAMLEVAGIVMCKILIDAYLLWNSVIKHYKMQLCLFSTLVAPLAVAIDIVIEKSS